MNKTCEECGGKCCQTLMFEMPVIRDVEFMETRGSVVKSDNIGHALWLINAPCKHLKDGRCSVYEDRPLSCREYAVDGRHCRKTRELL